MTLEQTWWEIYYQQHMTETVIGAVILTFLLPFFFFFCFASVLANVSLFLCEGCKLLMCLSYSVFSCATLNYHCLQLCQSSEILH